MHWLKLALKVRPVSGEGVFCFNLAKGLNPLGVALGLPPFGSFSFDRFLLRWPNIGEPGGELSGAFPTTVVEVEYWTARSSSLMTLGKENSTLVRIFLHNGDGPPMEGDNASTGALKIGNAVSI